MAGLPSSVVQRAAVLARQLKARLGAQQQDRQQQQQQPGQLDLEGMPAAEQGQHQHQEAAQSAVLPGLLARVYQALKVLQQGDNQLSEHDSEQLQKLQASAVQVLAADGEQSS